MRVLETTWILETTRIGLAQLMNIDVPFSTRTGIARRTAPRSFVRSFVDRTISSFPRSALTGGGFSRFSTGAAYRLDF